ncbi:MAG: hypothetical protein EHM35_02255 [Planctomycetaceae bacterium]|nr:MAG: hypothetical protein EHM35_02255 [Planctomycetaceae bacterium]
MRREEATKIVLEALAEMGVPKHISSVSRVPAKLEIRVVIAGQLKVVPLRSGITPQELQLKIEELQAEWNLRDFRSRQVDLEDGLKVK